MRFQDFKYRGNFTYLPIQEPKKVDFEDPWEKPQLIESDDGLLTTRTFIFYKQTFLCNLKLTGAQLINMSNVSILKPELPFASVDDVLKSQWDKPTANRLKKLHRTRKQIDQICDNYLIPRGIYAKYHKKSGAIMGIEIVGEMPQKILGMRQQVEQMEMGLKQWTPPDKEKPYWTRKDAEITEIPDWEWSEDEPDTDDAVQAEQQPISEQDAKASSWQDLTTTAFGPTTTFIGGSAGGEPPTSEQLSGADTGQSK
jgi:hypothetical protein